jgi:hypothetical protein
MISGYFSAETGSLRLRWPHKRAARASFVVHRRYRTGRIGVLEVCSAIPRPTNRLGSMIYAGKICFRTSISAVGAVTFGLWLAREELMSGYGH